MNVFIRVLEFSIHMNISVLHVSDIYLYTSTRKYVGKGVGLYLRYIKIPIFKLQ